jgi:hypothetical protein
MSVKRILIAASMNGGAEAVAPVAKRLREQWREVDVISFKAATDSFKSLGVEPDIILEKADATRVAKLFSDRNYSAILTGTQGQSKDQPITLEQILWQIGKNHPWLTTIAVMDTWGNERERFSDLNFEGANPLRIKNPLVHLPYRITVIDEYQFKTMQKLGFDPEILIVVGNPYFEMVRENFSKLSPSTRQELLAKPRFSKFNQNGKLIVYMSDNYDGDLGFTEKSVMESFLRKLDAVAEKTGMAINVIVRPHPFRGADAKDAFDSIETPYLVKELHNPVTAKGSDPANNYSMEQLLASADLVVGTCNNPLVTAMIIGKRVLNYMPNLNPKYDYHENLANAGLTTRITAEGALEGAISDLLEGKIVPKAMKTIEGSTQRVIELIDRTMRWQ